MDLRSIINNEAGENSSSKQTAPATPIQASPQQGFREYSYPSQVSPGKPPSHDYSGPQHPTGSYASPSSYPASYPGRPPPPPPPPIQAPPQNDLRSPAGSYTAQSPYRQTPTSSMSGGQYPFPQAVQTPQSPAQQYQYPPSYRRDSYSQSNHPPPHLQHHNSQSQASPAPQTPPIGMPGQPHPYLQHQRSQSSISISTPTSAQSQQQYFNQYPQDSPISTTHFPPSQISQNQLQHSQPGTPLGPPTSQRQTSGGFTHPTSPYQQRGISQGPFANYPSPAPPPPSSIPRLPSTPSAYGSQRTSTSEPQRRSQSERERSLSVSPKTRLPSQPPGGLSHIRQQSPYNSSVKRKMEDRESSVEEVQRFEQHDVKPQVNGEQQIPQPVTSSPQQPARKRVRYTEPPIWAQSVKNKNNFIKPGKQAISKTNGGQPIPHLQSQNAAPPLVKAETNGHPPIAGATNRPVPVSDGADDVTVLLGSWEPSISNVKPTDAMAKEVADWLFRHVVSRPDIGELTSRGVEVEIEAKLGQLIDKDTGVRFSLPIRTEAVLQPLSRIGFRSSMTENQHKVMNNFLNGKVQETHPQNPGANKQNRVPIAYLHRREKDEFYELPPSYNTSLAPAVQQTLKEHNLFNRSQKLRISRDQKTHQVLGKIIKARIADLDILFPESPLDCRISVNFEMRFDGEIEEAMALVTENRQPDRLKDRMSYTQSHYQIDLTQVTQSVSVNGMNRPEKEHELEIELSTAALRDQGQKAVAGQPQKYLALVEGLIDNVRLLVGTVPPQ
ncbi:mRNA 5 -triphosphatase [Hyphodiscus hymeniophilus]|uniref:mRNA-capping enzyme subunit beta n=1 Tax=Hyphodiscus hymeniophilus TaxID=353542 RepID=A0A9P6SQ81_9HELO|nr:mRNA 5 -triphosphatase [Hyphodiscus hymeniophilus]